MHVIEHGPRSTNAILLLHGQMQGAEVYEELAPRLARATGGSVLVPELPGYGRSPLPEPYSLRAVQQALLETLRARGIGAVAVVGYSLGAYHALALALAGGPRVTALALVGAVAGIDAPLRDAFRGYAAAVRAGAKLGDAFAALALPEPLAAAHPGVRARAAARADAVAPATLAAELDAVAAMDDLRPRLGEVRAPTLVRVGDQDQNAPAAFSREIAAGIPGARLEIAAGVAHLYWDQDAEPTCASVERFLLEAARAP